MPRGALAFVALALAVLSAYLAARPGEESAAPLRSSETASPPTTAVEPPLAAAPRMHAPDAGAPPTPWWIEADVASLDPRLRAVRIEARWWPSKPSTPYADAAAVVAVDAPILDGRALVRVPGDARPGWAVLFVVEGERRRLAYPWIADPWTEVRPGFGSGPVVGLPVLVGARSLRLRLLDREDLPIAGTEVGVHDPENDLGQVAATDPDGRVRFDALRAAEVRVGWERGDAGAAATRTRWPERSGDPYRRGDPRPVRVEDGEVVLRVPRRALLRVRGRVAGTPDDAWLAVDTYARGKTEPDRVLWTTASNASHGTWVDPGSYRVGGVLTPSLEADTEVTVDLPMTLGPGDGWLDVAFDVPALPGDDRVACAVEARRLHGSTGWQGGQATAPHHRALLLLPAGAYEVTGAVRTDGGVRFSAAQRAEVRAGEGTSITLATAPAGTLRLAGPYRGRECEVVEREFPKTGAVAARTFRFVHVSWPQEPTDWWLPAGPYVLRQIDDDEPGSERRVAFEVREGASTELVQDANGWFDRPPP